MIDVEELKKRLMTPCGRTTGHGERCATGWECSACAEKKKAADAIEHLQRELEEARSEQAAQRELWDAVWNLIAMKGRHNTEIAYHRLEQTYLKAVKASKPLPAARQQTS